MKQVLVRGGKVQIEDVPPPALLPGSALVRVHRSCISSGTESGLVSGGGTAAFALKKARDPLNIEKVKRKLASVGVKGTLELVKSKLFEFQAPGYSSAGEVVDLAADVPGFRVGDRVACAGAGYASHAEYNVVPHQLLTPMPDGVAFDEAAFVALGAIALQGVRQAAPTLGETCIVAGLGLIGQLTSQLLRAAGCRVIGCDLVTGRRALAESLGCDVTCPPDELPNVTQEWTGGHGADAVLICAAAKDSRVTNQALDLCRHKGRVVVVGAVGLDLQRDPLYMKELDFRLSCSYGPGRYQPHYEESGLDYPIGYVRWTEGRNMAEFLRLVSERKVHVRPLISVTRPVAEAQAAYDAILDPAQGAIAAVLAYAEEAVPAAPPQRTLFLRAGIAPQDEIGVAVVGAGAFASAYHLPNLARLPGCRIEAVVARTGAKAKQAGDKFGARYCTSDYREVLADPKVHAVVIATRHDLHAEIALAAAESGKHLFVEKPLALTVSDCTAVCEAVSRAGVLCTVGFNRRFSKLAQAARVALADVRGPRMILYRINAGPLPPGHWATDPAQGGGRILGEAVHFFDFCGWLVGSKPAAIQAERIDSASEGLIAEDNLSVTMRYSDGSVATVFYACLGHPNLPKERIEIFAGGGAVCIEDFRGITFAGLRGTNVKPGREDKGQFALIENFVQAIRGEAALAVTAEDGLEATRVAREALRMAARGGAGAEVVP